MLHNAKKPGKLESLPGRESEFDAGLDQGVIVDPQVNRPLAQGLAKSPQQQHVHKQVVRPLKMRLFYSAPRAGVKFSR